MSRRRFRSAPGASPSLPFLSDDRAVAPRVSDDSFLNPSALGAVIPGESAPSVQAAKKFMKTPGDAGAPLGDVIAPPWDDADDVMAEGRPVAHDPVAPSQEAQIAYVAAVTTDLRTPEGEPYEPGCYERDVLEQWRRAGLPAEDARTLVKRFSDHRHPVLRANVVHFSGAVGRRSPAPAASPAASRSAAPPSAAPPIKALADLLLDLAEKVERSGRPGSAVPAGSALVSVCTATAEALRRWATDVNAAGWDVVFHAETALSELEDGLIAAMFADAPPELVRELEASVAAALDPYRPFMSPVMQALSLQMGLQERLRRVYGLPRLTLLDVICKESE